MKRALFLIIDRLGDVSQAIAFAKEQDDPDLWEDLLNYSMDKPRFIRGLLEEVGTAIDPVRLVRRIPEGLQIEGLRDGLKHMLKEHDLQQSISIGVARVLRSEVAAAQTLLRNGQRKGIKFEIVLRAEDHIDVQPKAVATATAEKDILAAGIVGADGSGGDKDVGKPAVTASGDETAAEPVKDAQTPHDKHSQPRAAMKPPRKWRPGHCAQCFEPFTEWEAETLVGFACGHVFHLTHLLAVLHPGEPPDVDFLLSATEERLARGPSRIGTKVTHARLLRDRMEGGCPVCRRVEVVV